MVNHSKLHSLDEECLQILEETPKGLKSKLVRDGIKTIHRIKLNEKKESNQGCHSRE